MASELLGVRRRECKSCGNNFEYQVRRGSDRLYCTPRCAGAARSQAWRKRSKPPCSVDGCDKPSANLSCGYCDAHYARLRRKGRLELDTPRDLADHSHGYKLLYAPGHPLCTKGQQSRVYEHRAVYHALHGDGPFACYHCGCEVTWADMHVDHLNDVRDDNSPGNLAASCPACNKARGEWKMRATMRQRSLRQYTWGGMTQCASEWARSIGISHAAFMWRVKAGWPLSRIMSEPRGATGPRAQVTA